MAWADTRRASTGARSHVTMYAKLEAASRRELRICVSLRAWLCVDLRAVNRVERSLALPVGHADLGRTSLDRDVLLRVLHRARRLEDALAFFGLEVGIGLAREDVARVAG